MIQRASEPIADDLRAAIQLKARQLNRLHKAWQSSSFGDEDEPEADLSGHPRSWSSRADGTRVLKARLLSRLHKAWQMSRFGDVDEDETLDDLLQLYGLAIVPFASTVDPGADVTDDVRRLDLAAVREALNHRQRLALESFRRLRDSCPAELTNDLIELSHWAGAFVGPAEPETEEGP